MILRRCRWRSRDRRNAPRAWARIGGWRRVAVLAALGVLGHPDLAAAPSGAAAVDQLLRPRADARRRARPLGRLRHRLLVRPGPSCRGPLLDRLRPAGRSGEIRLDDPFRRPRPGRRCWRFSSAWRRCSPARSRRRASRASSRWPPPGPSPSGCAIWIFTGFPWNLIGTAWTGALPVAEFASLTGALGLACSPSRRRGDAGEPWCAPAERARSRPPARASACSRWSRCGDGCASRPGRCRPCQTSACGWSRPAIPQSEKWAPDNRPKELLDHIALTRSPGFDKITAVIWPETAAPYFIDQDAGRAPSSPQAAPPGGLSCSPARRARHARRRNRSRSGTAWRRSNGAGAHRRHLRQGSSGALRRICAVAAASCRSPR